MLSRYLWVIALFIISGDEITGQNDIPKKLSKSLERAEQLTKQNDFDKALKCYESILEKNPKFIQALIGKGEVLQKMENYPDALLSYEQVLDLEPNYIPRLHYTSGILALRLNNFSKAKSFFSQYLKYDTDSRRAVQAKRYQQVAAFREDAVNHPVPFQPVRMPNEINSEYPEFLPSLTVRGTMIFSRRINNQEDLFYSINKNGKWESAIPINSINTPENEAAHSISANGNWLVITMCNQEESLGSCDLFISQRNGNKWTKPVNMGSPVNTSGWEAQPSLSADGNTLIFASNRRGGYGEYDLWKSSKINGKWTTPVNLGPRINTNKKEESPFLHPDGVTLYFSSNGHIGMGDKDLFVSRLKDSIWGESTNLGYPLNTKNHEGAMSVSTDGKTAYYASDREQDTGRDNNLDIYTFQLPEKAQANPVTYVSIRIFDNSTLQPLSGTVRITDLGNNNTQNLNLSENDSLIHILQIGTTYALQVSADGFNLYSEHISLDSVRTLYEPYFLSIGLDRLTEIVNAESKPIILRNIFFATGSSQLLNNSIPELEYLYSFLIQYPDIKIAIHGHTDNIGSDTFNDQLSLERANAVRAYLLEKGVSSERLNTKGFGASQPIGSNLTEAGRQTNRRTEFIIKK